MKMAVNLPAKNEQVKYSPVYCISTNYRLDLSWKKVFVKISVVYTNINNIVVKQDYNNTSVTLHTLSFNDSA